MTTGIKNTRNRTLVLLCSILIVSSANAGGSIDSITDANILKENRVPLGNINGSTGNVFKKGIFRVVLKDVYFKADTIYDGNTKVKNILNKELKLNASMFIARYGLGNGFDVRLVMPIISKKLSLTIPQNYKVAKLSNSGIGDISIIGRYSLLNQKKGDPLFLSIGAGIKVPTGKTDKKFKTPKGNLAVPQLQNGTGSVDFIIEAGATKILKNSRIDSSIVYKVAGDGDNNYKFGNILKWNIGYSYALTNAFDLQLELDGIHSSKHKQNGKKLADMGGTKIYLTPGVHYRFTKHFDVSFGYAFNVYTNLNFSKKRDRDSSIQIGGLCEKGRFITRVGYTF